jgi:hypothetical protein
VFSEERGLASPVIQAEVDAFPSCATETTAGLSALQPTERRPPAHAGSTAGYRDSSTVWPRRTSRSPPWLPTLQFLLERPEQSGGGVGLGAGGAKGFPTISLQDDEGANAATVTRTQGNTRATRGQCSLMRPSSLGSGSLLACVNESLAPPPRDQQEPPSASRLNSSYASRYSWVHSGEPLSGLRQPRRRPRRRLRHSKRSPVSRAPDRPRRRETLLGRSDPGPDRRNVVAAEARRSPARVGDQRTPSRRSVSLPLSPRVRATGSVRRRPASRGSPRPPARPAGRRLSRSA